MKWSPVAKMAMVALLWVCASTPARAGEDDPSPSSVRKANGRAIAGLVVDATSIGLMADQLDTPEETASNQRLTGVTAALGRSMGIVGALRAASDLDELGQPVSRLPGFAAVGVTVGAFAVGASTGPAPREQSDQVALTVVHGAAATLVAVQVHLNRMAVRTIDPPPRMGPRLRLDLGPGRLGVSGVF